MKNADVIERMVRKLVEEYRPEKIILFGSYAWGEPDSDSDIDLFIIKDTDKRKLDRMAEVRRILTGLHDFIPLDTIVMTPEEFRSRSGLRDPFVLSIAEEGKKLYETS